MERCPYCGASVRSGARFCTSCGRRLTGASDEAVVAAAPANQASDNGPEPTDQPVAWESVPTSVERSTPTNEDWPRRAPIASADLWPSSVRESEAPAAVDAAPPPVGDVGEKDDQPGVPAWTSSPWSSWAMPPAVEEAGEEAAPVALAESGGGGVADDLAAGLEMDFAASADTPVEAPAEALVPPVAATGATAEGVPSDALGRAVGLVDELRAILPAVAGLAGVDVGGAIAVLRAARSSETELSADELSDLVASVEAARARPREIDALLGLAGSLDGLAVVVMGYQRLSGAIDEAVALLGGAARETTEDDRVRSDGAA